MCALDALAQEINGAIRAHGVPSSWLVRKRDYVREPDALCLVVDGETWGYKFVEICGDLYVGHAQGKERRWKLKKTAVDRMSKRIIEMYEAREQERRRRDRTVYIQGLIAGTAGLHGALQSNIFYVDGTDCRLWVYPDHIQVESRNYGIYARIATTDDQLDAVIEHQVRTVVAEVSKIYAAAKAAETAIRTAIEGPGLSSSEVG